MLQDRLIHEPPGSAVFQVWGDELLQAGDPRGELVQLSRQPRTPEVRAALDALLTQHPEWTLGCQAWFSLELRDGFIDALVMHEGQALSGLGSPEGYTAEPELPILRDPMTARLRRFTVDTLLSAEGNHGCWGSQTSTLEALTSQPRPWLRTVEFDRWMMTEPLDEASGRARLSHALKGVMHEAEVSFTGLSRLWKLAPRLEHLVVAQGLETELGHVQAPHLRTLCLGLMSVGLWQLDALADAVLPELTWLELRLQREPWRNERIDAQAVWRMLNNRSFGKLEHLALLGTGPSRDAGDEVLAALARWPRLSQLRSLDLGGLEATPQAWRALVDARPSLERVWVSRNVVRDPEWLEAVLPVEWRKPEATELADG